MNHQEEIKTLRELIKDIDIAMLTTVTEEGLVSRPMKTQEVEFDGDLWFFTKKDTEKYQEILHNQDVNVAYVGGSYVSIRGNAHIVEDIDKKKELWSNMYEQFLKTTYEDPNVILIKVNVETAEYWDQGNLAKNILYMFKRLTGQNTDTVHMNETLDFLN